MPSDKEEIMKDITNNRERLNPEFLSGIACFRDLLRSKLAPKQSINKGEKITGEGKKTYLEVSQLNSILRFKRPEGIWPQNGKYVSITNFKRNNFQHEKWNL